MPVVIHKTVKAEKVAQEKIVQAPSLAPADQLLYGQEDLATDLAQIQMIDMKLAQAKADAKKILEAVQPDIQRRDELAHRILKAVVPENAPHDFNRISVMHGFVVDVGKAPMSRTVSDKQKAAEYMGENVFWQVCTLPLKSCDDYLSLPQRADVITTTYDESKRPLHVKIAVPND